MLDKLRQMQRVEADPQVLANCLTVLMQVWGSSVERAGGNKARAGADEGSGKGGDARRRAGGTQGGPRTPILREADTACASLSPYLCRWRMLM